MQSTHPSPRSARFDVRVNRRSKRLIEKAAALAGQSVSEFAASHVVRAAEEAVRDAAITRLSERDRDAFLKLIGSDVQPNQALKRAAKRYWERRV